MIVPIGLFLAVMTQGLEVKTSQADLARKLGVPRGMVSLLVSLQRPVPYERLRDLNSILGIHEEALMQSWLLEHFLRNLPRPLRENLARDMRQRLKEGILYSMGSKGQPERCSYALYVKYPEADAFRLLLRTTPHQEASFATREPELWARDLPFAERIPEPQDRPLAYFDAYRYPTVDEWLASLPLPAYMIFMDAVSLVAPVSLTLLGTRYRLTLAGHLLPEEQTGSEDPV